MPLPNTPITLIPQTLESPCYVTEQDRLNDFVKHILGYLSGNYSTFVIGSTTPAARDRTKPWLKLDANGRFVGVYTYANGSWVTQEIFKTGMIIMFSGDPTTIAAPWYLCNGENSTPDLRDRFILGWGSARPVGTQGGEETHTLTIEELAAHTHTLPMNSGYPGGSGSATNMTTSSTTSESESAGGGQPHNNMPPFYALAFIMYKETA